MKGYIEKSDVLADYALGAFLVHSSNAKSLIGDYKSIPKESFSGFFKFANSVDFIQEVSFVECFLNNNEAKILSKFLKRNKKIKFLNIEKNEICVNGLKYIFNSLINHLDLKEIFITQNLQDFEFQDLSDKISAVISSCPKLYKIDFNEEIVKENSLPKIKKALAFREFKVISKIINELYSKQLFLSPQHVLILLRDMGLTQEKIGLFLGIDQSYVSRIINGDRTPKKIPGKIILKHTPHELEKISNKNNFFIYRYGLSKRKYSLIENKSGILLTLLGQPIKNPYYGLKDGPMALYRDYSDIFSSRSNLLLSNEGDIQNFITMFDISDEKNQDVNEFSAFWNFYLNPETQGIH